MPSQAALIVLEGANRGAVFQLLPLANRLGCEQACEVLVLDEAASRTLYAKAKRLGLSEG